MHLSPPYHDLSARTATVFRLLAALLVVLAMALDGRVSDPRLVTLVALYVVSTGLFWLLLPRCTWFWILWPLYLVDVGFVTSVLLLSPAMPFPLWILYLLAIASSAATGRATTIVVASLAAAAHAGISLLEGGSAPFSPWSATFMATSTFAFITLATRWRTERQERRAWQDIATAVSGLGGAVEPDEVALTVVQRARRLVEAERAWLWWSDEAGQLLPGPGVGATRVEPFPGTPDSLVARVPDRGVVSLADLGGQFADLIGEAIMLRHGEVPVVLLAVAWSRRPGDEQAQRERLSLFAPWAADVLYQARACSEARAEEQAASMLRAAAMDMAATFDRQVVLRIAVDAVQSGLGAAAALVERSTGRVVFGDGEAAQALVRPALGADDSGKEIPTVRLAPPEVEFPLVANIGEDLALVAWRNSPPMGEVEGEWLGQLAPILRIALDRCALYEQAEDEVRRLRRAIEGMPAPVALWEASGKMVLASADYRSLELPMVVEPDWEKVERNEEEVGVGDPPRTFVAMTVPVDDGKYAVSLYREVTRELEALRAKDELIAMVGHELRTPLTTIYGYSQMMARQLGVVQRQVNQLNRLIGDFVDAARLEGGRLSLERQPVDLAELAQMAADRFRGACEGRPLQLELADVPLVEGDPSRLEQVLDNLLVNAAKYSPTDQEIILAIRTMEGQAVISVQDHGVGIAPQHLPRVFDRFYRVPGPEAERVKGSGLGLSIVRDLVTAHGGRVWAESGGPGLGSTFWVSLPAMAPGDGTRRLKVVKAG